jgi:hypothetical protein
MATPLGTNQSKTHNNDKIASRRRADFFDVRQKIAILGSPNKNKNKIKNI